MTEFLVRSVCYLLARKLGSQGEHSASVEVGD